MSVTKGHNLVFVVGIPRSGTTWVLSILENHPACLSVTADMLGITVDSPTKETGLFVRGFSDEEIIKKLSHLGQDILLVEKTPAHLFELNRIKKLFPRSKIILIRRNPLDVIYSMVQKTPFWKNSPNNIEEALALYKRFYDAQSSFIGFDYVLEYERLWENPVAEARRLFEFLGINADTAEEIIEKTMYGRSLQPNLKTVFRIGSPRQGLKNFTKKELDFISQRFYQMGVPSIEIKGLETCQSTAGVTSSQKKIEDSNKLHICCTEKILLTNHQLYNFAGSEVTIYHLAREFQKRGCKVTVATFIYDYPIKELFETASIEVVDVLEHELAEKDFDLIWSHHSPVLYNCIFKNKVRAKKIIFSSLSPWTPLESPPLFANELTCCLAISEETKKRLITEGVLEEKVHVFPNSVDEGYFCAFSPDKARSLRKVYIVSNHIPKEACKAAELLKDNGIEVEFFGISHRFEYISPEILSGADVVITIGRTVPCCLAVGIPVYCYDRFGGPGWIDMGNIDLAGYHNFSGRCSNRKIPAEEIYSEIKGRFEEVFNERKTLHHYARQRFNLSDNLSRLLEPLKTSNNVSMELLFNKYAVLQRSSQYYEITLKAWKNLEVLVRQKDTIIKNFETHREKDSTMVNLKMELKDKDARINTLETSLKNVYSSRGWKFLSAYYSIRDKIFPPGSYIKKAAQSILGISAKKVSSEKSVEKLTSVRYLPDALQSLRIMHIGGYWRGPNDTVRHMMLGLQSVGVHVFEYNTDQHPEALDTEGRPYDRGTLGPVWIREEFIHDSIKQFRPHVIICNAGGLSFYPEVSKTMRRDYYLIGIALSDPDVFEPTTRLIAMNFDLYLTNEKNLLPKYEKLGVNAAPLPFGTNEKHFRPLPPLQKYKTDVLIIGRAHPNRIEPVKAIMQRFNTAVYGEGWEKYDIQSRGFIFGDETMHALNSAKIIPIFLYNPEGSTMFVKPSILDFPAAGALVITNYLKDVEQYLSYGREIIGFNSTEDLISKIDYYLSHPDEAESIRKAGHSRVLKEHTWACVWPRILKLLGYI